MARKKIDKETRRAIIDARHLVEDVMRMDGNESETRRRVERIFETVMGYDALKHLTRERAVRGAGEAEYVDFAVQLEPGKDAKPLIMVELKRVGVDLARKHLRQVSSYAIDAGSQWIILTNGREWRLYHVEFGMPPETVLVEQWDLTKDDPTVLAERFDIISYKNVRKGGLDDLWRRTKVLAPENLLAAMFSPEAITLIRSMLRKSTGVVVARADVFSGLSKLLNESAAIELSALKIAPPEERRTRQKVQKHEEEDEVAKTEETEEESEQEIIVSPGHPGQELIEQSETATSEEENPS